MVVEEVDSRVRLVRVYNFSVANAHSYFVGGDGVLVHNSSLLKGSGPVPGVIEISERIKSIKAFKNYFPSKKRNNTTEYIFDPKTNTFLVGQPKYGNTGGHPGLAKIMGYGPHDKTVVAGMFSRCENGGFFTTEHSGHYYENWNDQLRNQFLKFMKSKDIDIDHTPGL